MFFIKKLGCRAFQTAFRALLPFLPYREPAIIPSYDGLAAVFKKEKTASVLIVTSPSIVKNGLISPLERVLEQNHIRHTVYDQTRPDPTVANVEDALQSYRENGCDTLIAIGGGSVMDCAKGVGARVAYPKKRLNQMGGVLRIRRRIPTLIAIPTTAGTGSETSPAAVITDSDTHHKYAIMSFPLIPHYAILDACLAYSVPPQLTATTGMDALTHAVEAYIGHATTKKTRALALEATALIFENLEKAYADGQNHESRENLLRAAYKAGVAFSTSYVGYVHALAHALGGTYGTPHGLANAVIMPYVLDAYGKSAHKKLHRLGMAAGVCDKSDTPEAGATKFIDAIKALNARMNIPSTLSDIKAADIPAMAKHAEKEANPLYPVPKLMTKKELEDMYLRIAGESTVH